jgi:hypothetical protein
MNFFFGKKQTVQAFAEVLEDGKTIFSDEMKKPNRGGYREYHQGSVPTLEIAVQVQPENEPAYEAKMKVAFSVMNLLRPGVRVQVRYDPARKEQVTLDDEIQSILKRNPQIIKGGGGLIS